MIKTYFKIGAFFILSTWCFYWTANTVVAAKFINDFERGNYHSDVRRLQEFLNDNGYLVAKSGPGSPGQETTFFGPLTERALIAFQQANNIVPSSGFFGPKTRHIVDRIIAKSLAVVRPIINSIIGPVQDVQKFDVNESVVEKDDLREKIAWYKVGGAVTGLSDFVVLKINNADEIIIYPGQVSDFVFSQKLISGSNYVVTVSSGNPKQKCYISNNIGIIKNIDISNVRVACGLELNFDPFVIAPLGSGLNISDSSLPSAPALSSAKKITSFGVGSVLGVIDEVNHVITVNLPNGSDVTALSAVFATTGSGIAIGGVAQLSGVTVNDFTSTKIYTVTAEDGTSQNYAVTINVLESNQIAPDASGDITLNNSASQAVIINPDQALNINIESGTIDPTINVSSFVSAGSAVLPAMTIAASNAYDMVVNIPAGVTVVSADVGWNGVMTAPTSTTASLPVVEGQTLDLIGAIKIGFVDSKLSFDKAVRFIFPNQAGKRVGYDRADIDFTEITSICSADSQAAGDDLAVDGDCKIDVGSDLVVWTKHFTVFIIFEQLNNSADLVDIVLSNAPMNYIFASSTYAYNDVRVLSAVESITVTPTGAGVITVDGDIVESGASSAAIALTAGVEKSIVVTTTESGKATKSYTIKVIRNSGIQATPTFDPASGAVAFGSAVTINSADADDVYYTTDGSEPAVSVIGSTLKYITAIIIDIAKTIKAIAVRLGYDNSAVGEATYIQAAATTPVSIVLAVGDSNPVGGVTNVSMPAAGETDATGAVTGWVETTAANVKFTVTDSGSASSTITIDSGAYTSGADYTITSTSSLSIVVTTTEANKVTVVRTFTITVTAQPLAVGDDYQGGKIAYILQVGDPGYDANVAHGLIVAGVDQSTGAIWGCHGTALAGADGTAIGTGNQNTIDIMAGCATAGIAARICGDLSLNDYDDWYLPSKDELNKFYINRDVLGGFNPSSGIYQASSEANANYSWTQFTNGSQDWGTKSGSRNVRCMRSF